MFHANDNKCLEYICNGLSLYINIDLQEFSEAPPRHLKKSSSSHKHSSLHRVWPSTQQSVRVEPRGKRIKGSHHRQIFSFLVKFSSFFHGLLSLRFWWWPLRIIGHMAKAFVQFFMLKMINWINLEKVISRKTDAFL